MYFAAYELTLAEGLRFERTMFHQTFGTVSNIILKKMLSKYIINVLLYT